MAAFRATLEEISDSSLLLHVMDVRYSFHPEFHSLLCARCQFRRVIVVDDDERDRG